MAGDGGAGGYADGLAEARSGDERCGEERSGYMVRRNPGIAPGVLCKQLLDAANDFSAGMVQDDLAILAIRKD